MQSIDVLIKGRYVVTMNETRDVIRDGAVAIKGHTIIDVGKTRDLEAPMPPSARSAAIGSSWLRAW